MSDAPMQRDTFEWPSQAELADDATFRLWLIQALSSIHGMAAETARLQRVTNGRVTRLEVSTEAIPTLIYRLSWLERIVFGAGGALLLALLFAIAKGALKS